MEFRLHPHSTLFSIFLPFIVVAVLDLQGSSVSSISTASSYPENLARKKSFIKVALAGSNII